MSRGVPKYLDSHRRLAYGSVRISLSGVLRPHASLLLLVDPIIRGQVVLSLTAQRRNQ